ncbi:chitinase-related protein [Dunaliella salina]|uniref:Chitinase-related protein n=1 Tax=Dunaliella salina TaxID=3046 RepID=A0ABQ7H9X8_DUNSA|nr:chitinase-related protein [Dunaliella salina]|eukprot:KAF5843657.1 chitinase-related protein [Dunaliella salina]
MLAQGRLGTSSAPVVGAGTRVPLVSCVRGTSRRTTLKVCAVAPGAFGEVRPYTLRKGDTLESIAKKRDVTVEQLTSMNPDVAGQKVSEGQTILLPANKLSVRDKEILEGIGEGKGEYRMYPVRKGETINDIMSRRGINMTEMQSLNPGVDLQHLSENQLIKLPADKYTVREREMLIGSGVLPREFFEAARNPFVIGVGALLGVCGFVLAWMKFYKDPDFEDVTMPEQKDAA